MAEEEIDPQNDEAPITLDQNPNPKPEELVWKAIAPVKAEYLRPPPPTRPRSNDDGADDDVSERKGATVLVKEKKSRRQLTRERRQEQNSTQNICPEVVKQGSSDACRYGGNYRFNHDLDAFLAQKPADLEGCCPFVKAEESCPYGITYRFFNTHKENSQSECQAASKNRHGINNLNKDFQKLLWKNKVSFPKADAQLKLLGLKVVSKAEPAICQVESLEENLNGSNDLHVHVSNEMPNGAVNKMSCASEKDCLDDASVSNDSRPLKKMKCPIDELCCSTELSTCLAATDLDKLNGENGMKENSANISLDSSEADMSLRPHPREKKLIDFSGKLFLAPLTTVGNLPFRRICKNLGAAITCGEMAMCTNLLQGQASEWALLRLHSSEDIFGIQICVSYPDTIARTIELIDRECEVDYIDINMGCPIDIVCNKGAGSSLLTKPMRMKSIIQAASSTADKPITVNVV